MSILVNTSLYALESFGGGCDFGDVPDVHVHKRTGFKDLWEIRGLVLMYIHAL
jgi:hypothetical protein